jgi:hypothetical protein
VQQVIETFDELMRHLHGRDSWTLMNPKPATSGVDMGTYLVEIQH